MTRPCKQNFLHSPLVRGHSCTTAAMLRYASLLLGASVLAAPVVHVSAVDERLAVVVPFHRGDLDLAVQSITNWPEPASCSPLTEQNMDLVLYYGGGQEDYDAVSAAADTIQTSAGRCFASTRTIFADLEKKVQYSTYIQRHCRECSNSPLRSKSEFLGLSSAAHPSLHEGTTFHTQCDLRACPTQRTCYFLSLFLLPPHAQSIVAGRRAAGG